MKLNSQRLVMISLQGAIAFLGCIAGAQVVDTYSFHVCARDGLCPSNTRVCVDAELGTICRYCSNPQREWYCVFRPLSTCHQYEADQFTDCGQRMLGTCDEFGVCVGYPVGEYRCLRRLCY